MSQMSFMQVNREAQYALIDQARKQFVRQQVDAMLANPMMLPKVMAKAISMYPSACGKVIKECMNCGNVESMLKLDELLRKAADLMANDDWHEFDKLEEVA